MLTGERIIFPGRENRGAADPVNSLLNYGYGMLYQQVETALILAGLDPFGGFLHVDRSGRAETGQDSDPAGLRQGPQPVEKYRFVGLSVLKLRVNDVKQYFYCPRIVYFNYVCPVRAKATRKMEYGREAHLELDRLEKRRTFRRYNLAEGRRIFHTQLYSARLGLEGRLDMYIEASGEKFPVEFKHTSGGPSLNHKYQLVAYAMLLEDHFNRPVRFGFIHLDVPGELHPVEITPGCREFVKEALGRIRSLVGRETMPPAPAVKKRCTDCEYKNFCGDVG